MSMKIAAMILACCCCTAAASGQAEFFLDQETEWSSAVVSQGLTEIAFSTGEGNLVLSEEVNGIPPNGTDMGSTLTWLRTSTGLGFDVVYRTLESGAGWVTDETTGQGDDFSGASGSTLSVGRGNSHYDDDFRIDFSSGSGIVGFQVKLLDNDLEDGEYLRVFDIAGGLIGELTSSTTPQGRLPDGTAYIGVLTDRQIGYIEFNEHSGFDNIALWDVRFAQIPSPATGCILGLGGLAFGRRRRI